MAKRGSARARAKVKKRAARMNIPTGPEALARAMLPPALGRCLPTPAE